MDSFYDAPRKPPPMPERNRLPSSPMVPEISVLCSSNGPQKPSNNFATYDQWKTTQNPYHHWLSNNKENTPSSTNTNQQIFNQQNTSYLKKQVRFESPVLQQRPSLNYEAILPKNIQKAFPASQSDHQLKRLEQIYLANIPNRQLDLSVIDSPATKLAKDDCQDTQDANKNEAKEMLRHEQPPKTYKEFRESQKIESKKLETDKVVNNDSVTDIFNYKRTPDAPVRYLGRFNPQIDPKMSKNILDFPKSPVVHECSFNNMQSPGDDIHTSENKERKNYEYINKNFCASKNVKPNFDYTRTPNKCNTMEIPDSTLDWQDREKHNNYLFYETNAFRDADVRTNFAIENRKTHDNPNFVQNSYPTDRNNIQNNGGFRKNNEICKCCKKDSNNALVVNNEDQPSVKDLLKIISQQNQQISQQNEQLIALQKQVTALITRDIRHDQEYQTQTEAYRFTNVQEAQKKSNNKRAFSIDFTTSVSFRGNFQNNNQQKMPENFGPKIQEITESCGTSERSDVQTLIEPSMVFRDPIEVRESCPSPEPSIRIDGMKDFEDSDAEDSDSDCSEIGPSFYKNLMAQVNNVLQTEQIKTADKMQRNGQLFDGRITNKTIRKVKEATKRHLQSIGVRVPEFDETSSSGSSEENQSFDQSDVSFTVKQLLMKYLPDEHLAKIAHRKPQNFAVVSKENIGAIKARPEFSFATVQYMKKYNLMAGSKQDMPKQDPKTPKSDRILDISKLKQQPKLM